jgi:hypothetical protein
MEIYVGRNIVNLVKQQEFNGKVLCQNNDFIIRCGVDSKLIKTRIENNKVVIFGTIFALFKEDRCVKFTNINQDITLLNSIISTQNHEKIVNNIEGRYLGIIYNETGVQEIFADKYSQQELFYSIKNGELIASTSIKPVISQLDEKNYDQVALANILSVYGNYAPKSHTLYKDIKRLGVGEQINIKNKLITLNQIPFRAKETQPYGDDKLEEYYQLFRSAVEVRSSETTNWVFMSSGWDSSAVLSMLCDIHGPSKIRAVIARIKYSTTSGVTNEFEIERAKKITDYFNVPLDVVDSDSTQTPYHELWEKTQEDFKSKHIYSLFAYNFYLVANYVRLNGSTSDAIFNGEISDGAHNLGFSQFATILEHPDENFREYSDKMASYLFGPSFFKIIENNEISKDAVFKLLRMRKDESIIDNTEGLSEQDWKYKYIQSFFLSSNRIPFAKLPIDDMLTKFGKAKYQSEICDTYFQEFNEKVTSETLYSWILHLYNSFHWQGGTVRGIMTAPENYNMQTSAPFWDRRLQDFLGSMPESWGRGLELKHTKYALKWMLKNKVDYPSNLQIGPHSYLYDTDPTWRADSDMLYGSKISKKHYENQLKTFNYKELLDDKFFNLDYINKLVDDYCQGKVETGQKLTDLKNIISLCNVGWY